MAKIYIGTSGFEYKDWGKIFYPKNISQKEHLSFYAEHFSSLELNVTFYRLPSSETFNKWSKSVPADFKFAVKVSKYITHLKHLNNIEESWQTFQENAESLGKKLGPFLLQFPASWKQHKEKLEKFLFYLEEHSPQHQYAFEFRDKSWFIPEIYELFKNKKLKLAFVITHSPDWISAENPVEKNNKKQSNDIIGNFIYIRMHGGKSLYSSKYSHAELNKVGKKILNFQKKGLDVYVYFNNDVAGYAPDNAAYLQQITSK